MQSLPVGSCNSEILQIYEAPIGCSWRWPASSDGEARQARALALAPARPKSSAQGLPTERTLRPWPERPAPPRVARHAAGAAEQHHNASHDSPGGGLALFPPSGSPAGFRAVPPLGEP